MSMSIILCGFYLFNLFSSYLANETLTSVNTFQSKEMTFPAVIICAWNSDFSLIDSIVLCKFEGKYCNISETVKTIDIVGYGLSNKHSCVIFNGINLLAEDKQKPLVVKSPGVLSGGMRLVFSIPQKVRIKNSKIKL